MGPARTTILGDVLVSDVGQVVGRVDVVPYPLFRKVIDGNKGSFDERGSTVGVANTARVVFDLSFCGGIASDGESEERFHLYDFIIR
jgi:hypothetical protein